MHSPAHLALQPGARSKKLGHLRNYREESPVVNYQQNKARTSLAVADHKQPLYGSSAWKQSEVRKLGHISNWDTEHQTCRAHRNGADPQPT